jgi:protein-S-isoprenylcysteine O-methyltransferase Ste14
MAVLVLQIGRAAPDPRLIGTGLALTIAGELVRLWGVRHIGTISRTRSDRLGPLVMTGPFAFTRNPLYIGNIALWTGFAVVARLLWLAPIVIALLAAEYHAIVRWEERLLESRLGDAYREYAARVPRWLPRMTAATRLSNGVPVFSWRETLFSERGTLIAIVVGYVMIWFT